MYRILLSISFSFIVTVLSAQTKEVDSLLKELSKETADSNKLKLYNGIGRYYIDNNYGKAIEYYVKGVEVSKKLERNFRVGNNYYDLGFAYLMKGDFDKSLENYLQSVRVYEELKDTFRLSNAYMSIGNVYNQVKNRKKTDEYFDKAQKLVELKNDSSQLISLFTEKGIVFDQLEEFDSALYYGRKVYHIALAMKDDYQAASALSNIALTYKHQKKTGLALHYFDSVLIVFKRINAPVDNLSAIYNNVGATHAQAGNYAAAKEAFAKSIAYAEESGARSIELENYRNLSDMYGDMKSYEQQNIYLKKYYTLKDSLFTADSKNQLTQLEADYHLEQKNSEIVKQEAEVDKQRNQRNIFIIIALAAALVLTALVFFYSRIKNKNKLLEEKNIQINKQKDELQTLNNVKDRLFSIISHDLRNPLITLRSYLTLADNDALPAEKKQQFKTQTVQAVSQTSDMLDNLLTWANLQIKNTSTSIKPVNVQEALQDAVNIVLPQAEQKGVQIHKNIFTGVALADEHILAITLRNLLTNAVKYTDGGKNIYLSAEKKGDTVFISVRDEGIGMSADQIDQLQHNQHESTKGTKGEKGSGLGLFLVKELLERIKGKLVIQSEKDKGSNFIISLPAL